ncbi:MAG TPA: CDP-diacylglycerol--glycerol-3-phosphate 3-phosphatidyltransferase [Syntrophorhabdaceae bacterium]|nr:CDP-diacylglycerol--glycerol-3-phosphate 3-phosphatidyltransferase [Syntrophorhabdaceae bacterium]HOL04694.1 CDP-diacylglycerol--glycerol-3-phosphate 3-phosphatidyltransferase [Syntrophorhabdaceae bacterium]HPC66128.1 CDP-diacylglycerol--glycerol-3-phosphate 3-phosphatidyltransferase [Syntrophorhabdaceae bacterium]HPP41122.1 CDP-diacylglycerol--glycerol-3-phosphate 3-phosphatidyltransferase [Syntrophorhabdaceae bacterium]HQE80700.1 CDP-diacylglycerol--glycerol-3-phosphate 3-phosphatidyltrans
MKVKDEKASVWTLPNRLSILRILFIPIIIFFIASQDEKLVFASGLLFIIAGITDGLDGYMARRMGLTSRLGVYLDPIADKLLVASVLITLTYFRMVPLWVTILLVAREFIINGLRSFYAIEGIIIYPSFAGKLKTFLQIIGIAFILFSPYSRYLYQPGIYIIYGALFFSLYSAYRYVYAMFKHKDTVP